ncbi:hypothetical protein GCM10027275_47260 [Rhabdobacter roseus]
MLVALGTFGTLAAHPDSTATPAPKPGTYTDKVVAHYKKQLTQGLDEYGPKKTAFWMASLDTKTGKYPAAPTRPEHIPQRAYLDRYVDAPKGATLYWDMPSIVAAMNLSALTKDDFYRKSATNYLNAFIQHCVADNGTFLWGNHYYYDAYRDSTMKFGSTPVAVNLKTESGNLHEARPIIPAWDVFWKLSPDVIKKQLIVSTENHLVDPETGEFNRHADRKSDHAFIEAGGILVYTMAWLYDKTKDPKYQQTADRIAVFSFDKRDRTTGLIPISPMHNRWDRDVTTTEAGLWASCVLKSAEWADKAHAAKWVGMADEAMTAWLKYSFDEKKQRYYGMLNLADGKPVWRTDNYPYKPQNYADVWEPLFPTHNYPISLAESCLMLYKHTKKEQYRQAVDRWVTTIREEMPARQGKGAYAEQYGRVIHFLLSCHEQLGGTSYKALATQVADEAVRVLWAQDMFRSHPGEDRYDAVDGTGILALSLLWLDSGKKPDMMGLYF